jgi:hypothetical protein
MNQVWRVVMRNGSVHEFANVVPVQTGTKLEIRRETELIAVFLNWDGYYRVESVQK